VLSLRNGDSKYAVVAGANILLDPTMYIAESKLHMLSPTARSSMWDASANGYAVFLPLCFPVGKDLC
jgi:aspyridone synthetase (hybrid polyketide synthase/nonribosomal peptide synthetase)